MSASLPTWFVLYGGHSADGRGPGVFLKRTTEKLEARAHFELIQSDPRSTGSVRYYTDKGSFVVGSWTKWEEL